MAKYYDGYDWDVEGFPGEYVYGDDRYVEDTYMDERWLRDVEEPQYWISNKGRTYSEQTRRFIHGTPLKSGHIDISMKHDGARTHRYVHRMVAEAFIPNPHNYPIVRHLDDDPSNNYTNNLAWGTQLHNMHDCIQANRFRYFTPEDIAKANAVRRTPLIAIRISDGKSSHFVSQQEASRILGIDQSSINAVLHGRRASAGGYRFIFEKQDEVMRYD